MRVAIVSDVHANLEALEAVLAHARAGGEVDAIWCAGDIVGYGPDPNAVAETLRGAGALCIAGNHDLAASGVMDDSEFNPMASAAVRWTAAALSAEHRAWLADLPLVRTEGAFTVVHGSLREPVWEYLLSGEQALAQFALQTTPYSIVGHSHLQFHAAEDDGAPELIDARDGDALALGERRLILNPGGAGQPRDGDPRAPYMLYDDAARAVSWHRVPYDVARTRDKITAAGLPQRLADRLAVGR